MSELSFMEKLLDGFEVEWKALGEVSRFINGRAYKKPELLEQGKYPVLRVGNFFTNANWYYSDLELEDDKYCDNGDLLYAWSASFGPRIWEGGKVIYHYHIWKVVPNADLILKKFLFYLLEWDTKALQGEHATGSTMMHVTKGAIESRLIPIPCPDNPAKSLEIQAEIVRILDAFTAMTAELTTELTTELNLRRQQYNYYRDQLLSFEEGEVEWSCLNELTSRTSNIRWQETDVTYQYIDLSSVSIENNSIAQTTEIDALRAPSRAQKLVKEHDVIFATTRPTQMRICLIPSNYAGAIASTGYCVLRAIQEKVLPKWIYYCLTSTYFKYFLEENQSGSAYPAISDAKLKEYSIPVPSLEEQARIVAILDKFDALTNSITEGLPREIELRQQQYEYYRDLLLSFPKPEAG